MYYTIQNYLKKEIWVVFQVVHNHYGCGWDLNEDFGKEAVGEDVPRALYIEDQGVTTEISYSIESRVSKHTYNDVWMDELIRLSEKKLIGE